MGGTEPFYTGTSCLKAQVTLRDSGALELALLTVAQDYSITQTLRGEETELRLKTNFCENE